LDPGTGWELSMRDPTVLIGAWELAWPGAEGLAALAGCEARVRQSTTAAVKAHFITRIYSPLASRSRLNDRPLSVARPPGACGSSNPDRCPVKRRLIRLMANRHRSEHRRPGTASSKTNGIRRTRLEATNGSVTRMKRRSKRSRRRAAELDGRRRSAGDSQNVLRHRRRAVCTRRTAGGSRGSTRTARSTPANARASRRTQSRASSLAGLGAATGARRA
jgi:hypothetical protein